MLENAGNMIVIGILFIVTVVIIRSMWKNRKKHKSCDGDCTSCGGCHARDF